MQEKGRDDLEIKLPKVQTKAHLTGARASRLPLASASNANAWRVQSAEDNRSARHVSRASLHSLGKRDARAPVKCALVSNIFLARTRQGLTRRRKKADFHSRFTLYARLLLFSGIALFLFTACQRQTVNQDVNVLRMVTSFKINNLMPTDPRAFFLPEFGVAELPLRLDGAGQLQPWLLESYAQKDARNWCLTLRPNVTFQNGKPLTAPALAAAMNHQLAHSASAQATLPGAHATATGECEVTLTTAQPDATVPNALADELVFPIYDVEAIAAASNDPAKLIGNGCFTGPYKVIALDEREMRMVRFEGYWRGQPPLREVSLRFVSDAQARVFAVQNDEADLALYPPSEAQRTLAGRNDAFFKTSAQSFGGPRLLLNVQAKPFDELAVRRAFSLGINYQSLATEVLEGISDVATGFYPPVWSWAVQNQKTDADEARRLLEQAGWVSNDNDVRMKNNVPLEITLLIYPQQPDFAPLATAMQAQLREVGFRVQIRQVEDINAAMRQDSNWHAAFHSPGLVTTGGAPDPFLRELLTSAGARNCSGINDPELDTIIHELNCTFAPTQRQSLLARLQQIIIAERVYEVRPVFMRSRVVVGRRWQSYQPSPQLHHITYETRADGAPRAHSQANVQGVSR
jgi:peptide/nickel transport system substrate-binding protein